MTHPTHQTAEVLNPNSDFPVLMFCEHAGNRLPPEVPAYLGMDNEFLDSYHGYDIGIPHVARKVANKLNATCILGVYSRLLIDLNRKLDAPDVLHDHDDNIIIPANQELSEEDWQHRVKNYYEPYHEICKHHVERLLKLYDRPIIFSFHSFPRRQTSFPAPFPFNFTIHYSEDYGVADVMRKFFAERYPEVILGDNDPYDIRSHAYIGTTIHGQDRGLPNMLIEIPNDQMRDEPSINKWSLICIEVIELLPQELNVKLK